MRLAAYGCAWLCLAVPGCTWLHLAAPGCAWPHLAAPGCACPCAWLGQAANALCSDDLPMRRMPDALHARCLSSKLPMRCVQTELPMQRVLDALRARHLSGKLPMRVHPSTDLIYQSIYLCGNDRLRLRCKVCAHRLRGNCFREALTVRRVQSVCKSYRGFDIPASCLFSPPNYMHSSEQVHEPALLQRPQRRP